MINDRACELNGLKEMVDYSARALVDYPERVEVTELAGEVASLIELRVAILVKAQKLHFHAETQRTQSLMPRASSGISP